MIVRAYRIATVLIATGFCADLAAAQVSLDTCLVEPSPICADPITRELLAIEQATPDPDMAARTQFQLAVTLAEGAQFDAATQVLERLEDPPGWPGLRDTAILDVITVLGAESARRGLAMLDMMSDGDAYERARAHHISNLVLHDSLDRALADLAATDRSGRPLEYVGLDKLAVALVADGQTDLALRLIAETIPDDIARRGSLLNRIVSNRVQAGQLDLARDITDRIDDPTWRVMAAARLGAGLAQAGDMAGAERSFAEARRVMATLPNADQRFYVYEVFARAALTIDRPDLALDAVSDVSSYRFDRVDALNMVAQIALNMDAGIDWRTLLADALVVLEDGPRDGAEVGERFDRALSFLAQTMAMSGDADWALQTLARVSDRSWREQDLANIALSLIEGRQYDTALTILAAHADWDMQAQGLITLARAADLSGSGGIADIAAGIVIGLVEGPEWVPLTDYTISRLAELESSRGQFEQAETRLRFLEDTHLQRLGRIVNLGFAAQSGTQDEFTTYLAIARQAVAQTDDPAARLQMTRNLVIELVLANRIDEALDVALEAPDAGARDTVLGILATALSGYGNLPKAMEAAQAIADPVMAQNETRMVLLAALRRSLYL